MDCGVCAWVPGTHRGIVEHGRSPHYLSLHPVCVSVDNAQCHLQLTITGDAHIQKSLALLKSSSQWDCSNQAVDGIAQMLCSLGVCCSMLTISRQSTVKCNSRRACSTPNTQVRIAHCSMLQRDFPLSLYQLHE